MINPLFYVALFAILGSWVVIDPMPGFILLNFPEFVGRVAFIVYYHICTTPAILEFHLKIFPIRSILFYSEMLEEAKLMESTPLGGQEDDN
jgi:hypothetical protein